MAADAWDVFDLAKESMGDGTIDMSDTGAGAFKCGLLLSTATVAQTAVTYTALVDTDKEATGGDYAAGGVALTSITWADTAGTTKWDAADIVFSATSTDLVARWAIIYHVASDVPVAMCLMDNTPGDVTVTPGNDLTLTIDAAGILTVSGGWT